MRLSQIIADVQVPSTMPIGRAPSAEIAGGAAAALAAGARGLQEIALKALEHQQKLQDAEKKIQVETDAASLQAQTELALSDLATTLRTERDPDRYREAWATGAQEVVQRITGQAKYPETQALLERRLPHLLAERTATAHRDASTLFLDQQAATLEATLEAKRQLAAQVPLDDRWTLLRHVTEGEAAITAATPVIGAKAAELRRQQWRREVYYIRGRAHRDADPEGFLREATREGGSFYGHMDPQQRQSLVESAERLAENRRRERVQEREKFERETAAEYQTWRRAELTSLDDLSLDEKLTMGVVRQYRDTGVIETREEYEHYIALARTGPKPGPSDARVFLDATQDIYSARPTWTEARVRQEMTIHMATNGAAGLSREDGQRFLTELNRRREVARSHEIQEAALQHEKNKESYVRAMDEGLKTLGVTTPLSQIDLAAGTLVAGFVSELNARTMDRFGNIVRPARDAMLEILPIFQARQSQEAKLKYDDQAAIVGSLLKSAPPGAGDPKWLAWYAQQVQAVDALRQSNPNVYALRRDQLKALLDLRGALIDIGARKTRAATAGGAAAGTPYTPPAALRK